MLHLLPHRTAGAAENMAVDFLLLQRYPEPDAARFRHYDWRIPAITFGYSQKWEFVRAQGEAGRDFCRRPSGGGIVDHAADWTYALVVARGHALHRGPAPLAYYLIHQALCDALVAQDQDVLLQPEGEILGQAGAGICFVQAEPHDVIARSTRKKVAGAALKRNKNGLLLQGSIAREALPQLDWSRFEEDFTTGIARCLSVEAGIHPWPELDPDEEAHLTAQFASPEWNERR
jgi:lipoyl(octanoyl) transferase